MDPILRAQLFEQGGKVFSSLLRLVVSRPKAKRGEPAKEEITATSQVITSPAPTVQAIALPTSEETTFALKRRLGRELYRAELDLAAGLKIAGKPCDCLTNKHTLELEAGAEELISQDPGNSVYRDIINWIAQNQSKVSIEAIYAGTYAGEYPRMANEFKNFRKRVMGSASDSTILGQSAPTSTKTLTLEQAKKLAAEEATKEVERQWHSIEKK